MLNPQHIETKRVKCPRPGFVRYRTEILFTVDEDVSSEMFADLGSAETVVQSVQENGIRKMWAVVYGDILPTLRDVVEVAKHCPPNYRDKFQKALLKLTTLLTPPKPNEIDTDPT